jgi:cytosine/adenosine deaminase-related metal-dependent hydrolase
MRAVGRRSPVPRGVRPLPSPFFGARLPRRFGRCGFGAERSASGQRPRGFAPRNHAARLPRRSARAGSSRAATIRGASALGSGDVPPANGKSARRLALVASSSVQSLPPHGAIKGEV